MHFPAIYNQFFLREGRGITIELMHGLGTGVLKYLSVAGKAGDSQIEGDSALLGSLHVPGSPELHVGFRDQESVVGLGHDSEALLCITLESGLAHQYTVALFSAPTYPATELMKLGESETLGILDNHDTRVRDIYPDFYHGRGDHNPGLSADEKIHLIGLLGGFELSVDHTYLNLRKGVHHPLLPFLHAFECQFLILIDKGIDDIYLPSGLQFTPDKAVHLSPVHIRSEPCINRLSSGRKFVDHAHDEVAVDCHGERSGYRSGRHHKNMGREFRFLPKARALGHTEAMLFVYHSDTKVAELHGVFDQGVRTDEDIKRSVKQSLMNLLAFFLSRRPGE